ncbi:hypothetical protein E2C01_059832 [Portunus trituberculatus]|uniref:Uncharacterized protein n=1 Tax=Portunus trituberculatus TaxID=210409 RepID=A0A5B7H6X4_PORTR|nr:hypothetical protein [Portunus trituberculatus]
MDGQDCDHASSSPPHADLTSRVPRWTSAIFHQDKRHQLVISCDVLGDDKRRDEGSVDALFGVLFRKRVGEPLALVQDQEERVSDLLTFLGTRDQWHQYNKEDAPLMIAKIPRHNKSYSKKSIRTYFIAEDLDKDFVKKAFDAKS